jgi:hypothetical protein
MKKFHKVPGSERKTSEERKQYATMKKNQRKAARRKKHIDEAQGKFEEED